MDGIFSVLGGVVLLLLAFGFLSALLSNPITRVILMILGIGILFDDDDDDDECE